MPQAKIKLDDPKLHEHLKKHCEDGWSARSFLAKLEGRDRAYYLLMKTDPIFKAIVDFYRKPCTIGYYTYQDSKNDSTSNKA